MFRYAALVWNTSDPQAADAAALFTQRLRATAVEWHLTLELPGLIVLHRGEWPGTCEVYPLKHQSGVVFGKLFSRVCDQNGFGRVESFSDSDSAAIVASKGRLLVDRYWGRYVAIVHDRCRRTTQILRGPQGGLPCLLTSYRGVNIFFSNIEGCLPSGLLKFTINQEYIATLVCAPALLGHAVALNEITEVMGGECFTIHSDSRKERSLYWDPGKIAMTDVVERADEAIREVRSTTRSCIWTWVAGYQRVLHNLSGGLDSAVVLSCLTSAPNRPTVVCVNYFDQSLYGDERQFARLAATTAGCRLVEVEHGNLMGRLECLRRVKIGPWPGNYQGPIHYAEAQRRIIQECGLEASFDGSFGDQLFYNLAKDLIAFDFLFRRGPGREFIRTAAAVARWEATTVWSVIARAIKAYVQPRSWTVVAQAGAAQKLVKPEIIAAIRQDRKRVHPWLVNVEGVPPGKQSQINVLTSTSDLDDDMTGLLMELDHPPGLLSQPLIELCLRIPTFVHSPYGAPRVVQRRAFANDIPAQIVERTTKGIVDRFLEKLVEDNRGFLREFMLDGWLVRSGMLDPVKLEGVLSYDNRLFAEGAAELVYEHLNTEAWLRSVERITKAA